MLNIISRKELSSFRSFTLTSGYGSENTRFVRVKDGYSVGADPLLLKSKNGGYRNHHVRGCGYLYGCRHGYVMATLKAGKRGWTDLIELTKSEYITFNPFCKPKDVYTMEVEGNIIENPSLYVLLEKTYPEEHQNNLIEYEIDEDGNPAFNYLDELEIQIQEEDEDGSLHTNEYITITRKKLYQEIKKITLSITEKGLLINDGKGKDYVYLGRFSTDLGEHEAWATPFKGLKTFMGVIRNMPDWAYFHWDDKSFNRSLTQCYDMGEVTTVEGLTPLQLWKEKYPDEELPITPDKVTGVYLNEKRNQEASFVSVRVGNWCMSFQKDFPSDEDFKSYDRALMDAYELGLVSKPSKAKVEQAKRIAKAQFEMKPKYVKPYEWHNDCKPVHSLRRRLYLMKVTGTLLSSDFDKVEYRGVKYCSGNRVILDMTYLEALAYYHTHCAEVETGFSKGITSDSHSNQIKFITPDMEEWARLSLSGVYEKRYGCDEGRAFTHAELQGVWACLDYYHHESDKVHKAVEASYAFNCSEESFKRRKKLSLEKFQKVLAEWFEVSDFKSFHEKGGSLSDFASIHQLNSKADKAIAKVDDAPIFWNARRNYPRWKIEDGCLVLTGVLNTQGNFHKTGTMIHYDYPSFKVTFNCELEVIDVAIQ